MDLQLHFGTDVVGIAEGAVYSDRTWYAVFRPAPDMPQRVRKYVAFCEEWHERLRAERPHSADEFEAWADVYASPGWRAGSADGRVRVVEGPVFIKGEVTWSGLPDVAQDSARGVGFTDS
ncbi:hypothetical protein [Gemmata sp.]|uniref:hypothetical protein n=1 Tax=Gemmata sp. TaxID=1914242 RepID=UPI003F70391C